MVNTDRKNNMINQLISHIRKMLSLTKNEYGTELERYILSKRPTSIEEIEFYTTQYDRRLTENVRWFR